MLFRGNSELHQAFEAWQAEARQNQASDNEAGEIPVLDPSEGRVAAPSTTFEISPRDAFLNAFLKVKYPTHDATSKEAAMHLESAMRLLDPILENPLDQEALNKVRQRLAIEAGVRGGDNPIEYLKKFDPLFTDQHAAIFSSYITAGKNFRMLQEIRGFFDVNPYSFIPSYTMGDGLFDEYLKGKYNSEFSKKFGYDRNPLPKIKLTTQGIQEIQGRNARDDYSIAQKELELAINALTPTELLPDQSREDTAGKIQKILKCIEKLCMLVQELGGAQTQGNKTGTSYGQVLARMEKLYLDFAVGVGKMNPQNLPSLVSENFEATDTGWKEPNVSVKQAAMNRVKARTGLQETPDLEYRLGLRAKLLQRLEENEITVPKKTGPHNKTQGL